MKISDAKKALHAMFEAPAARRRPLYLEGMPGIGKTMAPEQCAAEDGVDCIILQATNEDPITLSGLPARAADDPGHAVFLMFRDKLPVGGRGYLVIDELVTAPQAVQVGFNGLFLNGRLGSYRLPVDWYVCATGNRLADRASVNRMPTPVQNRVVSCAIEPDLGDWVDWALVSDIEPVVIAFLQFRQAAPLSDIPDMFNTFDPKRPGAFASPRSWHMASDILKLGMPSTIEHEMLSGTVGPGPAGELVAFLRIWRTLPNIDAVLLNPDTATVPTEMSTLYAVTGALAARATDANFDRVVTYLGRMPREFSIAGVSQATRRDAMLQNTRSFQRWARDNADITS